MTTTNAAPTGVRPAPEILTWSRRLVEPVLREAVESLPESMRTIAGYHFGWWEADGCPTPAGAGGGKLVRPALTLLAAEAVGAGADEAVPAAAAVELVHNFSLVQDDLIDGDLTRRHRPTVWSVFGAGQAIIAGDTLLALAFELLAGSAPEGAERYRAGMRLLYETVLALADGQHADLAFERRGDVTPAECLRMAEGKCGALLGCAAALGAWAGGAQPARVDALREFGNRLGVAFQLTDDLLGIWGDPAVTGKPALSDLRRRKKSAPVVAALSSRGSAGLELAVLYHRDTPLSGAELERAARLVESAGGRSWARERAAEWLAGARDRLHAAVGTAGRAAAELDLLAGLAVHRDR